LADVIKNEIPDAKIEFIRGSGGVFDVKKDDNLIFSKHESGRYPEEEEIIRMLK